jgi:hypothetical protein
VAKYEVILADGRITHVNADDESTVRHQAEHADRDRFVINVRRGQEPGPSPSTASVVTRIEKG